MAATSETTRLLRMRPSLETAVFWFDVAGVLLVVTLAVGVLCTLAIVFLGIVKEGHWDEAREAAKVRIAELASEGERARAEVERAHADIATANSAIAEAHKQTAALEVQAAQAREGIAAADARAAQANEGAAEANARAIEAKLALEKYKEHRRLNDEEKAEIAQRVSGLKGVQFAIGHADVESLHLGIDAAHALVAGGMDWVDWPFLMNTTNLPHDGRTAAMIQLLGTVIRVYNPAQVATRDLIASALGGPKFEGTNVEGPDPSVPGFAVVLVMVGAKR